VENYAFFSTLCNAVFPAVKYLCGLSRCQENFSETHSAFSDDQVLIFLIGHFVI